MSLFEHRKPERPPLVCFTIPPIIPAVINKAPHFYQSPSCFSSLELESLLQRKSDKQQNDVEKGRGWEKERERTAVVNQNRALLKWNLLSIPIRSSTPVWDSSNWPFESITCACSAAEFIQVEQEMQPACLDLDECEYMHVKQKSSLLSSFFFLHLHHADHMWFCRCGWFGGHFAVKGCAKTAFFFFFFLEKCSVQ